MNDKKINIPKKGAARKWSQKLKNLGSQVPPKDLVEKLNQPEKQKKIAQPVPRKSDLDI